VSESFALLDPDGVVVACRHETTIALIGRPFAAMFVPGHDPAAHLERARQKGRERWEAQVYGRDGTPYAAEIAVQTLQGPSSLEGFGVILRDLDARRLAEAALLETEIRFRTMADSAPVMLWMCGTDSLCTFFNAEWTRFTGRPLEAELGNGWAEGIHPVDFQPAMDTFLAAFVARESFSMDYRLRRADGEYRWIFDQGRPRVAPDGTFAGFIGSCVDVTEQREARRVLERSNQELEERVRARTAELEAANRGLEAFSYSVSHDLRAPLRAIDGFSLALLQDHAASLPPEAQGMLDRVRNAALRMAHLIDDLLRLGRLTRQEMRRELVDLSAMAREILAELALEEPERRPEIVIADGLMLGADRSLIRIALDNLLRNAWKFTGHRQGARIEVGATRQPDGSVAFFVADNGAGFDMAFAGKLFGVFQRLHGAQEFPGTGIGLATVQRIVERHGGRVWATGAIDAGATFYFSC
jgi:PAS domain S-box-containing protein